jgi:hypothetical protein
MSGVFQNIDLPPPSLPGECVPLPPLVLGEDTLAGKGEKGWGVKKYFGRRQTLLCTLHT